MMSLPRRVKTFTYQLFQPTDIAFLVFLRVVLGIIMTMEALFLLVYGWVSRLYIEPAFHFPFPGFGWVMPWPGRGMMLHVMILALLGVMFSTGTLFRVVSLLCCLGWGYLFVLDEGLYLNQYYLVVLLTWLFAWMPANGEWSVDATAYPAKRRSTTPLWTLWILRLQIGVVYLYNGLARVNPDWLSGEAMAIWLSAYKAVPGLGPWLATPGVAVGLSWGAMLVPLAAVPMLMWTRTRGTGYTMLIGSHVVAALIWHLGLLPLMMTALATVFFPPEWPREIWRWYGRAAPTPRRAAAPGRWQRLVLLVMGLHAALQILLPVNQFLVRQPGWTDDAYHFTWRMQLTHKQPVYVEFLVTDPQGHSWDIDPFDFLVSWQVGNMSIRPHRVLAFSHYLAKIYGDRLGTPVEVRADVQISINGRPAQPLVDPTIDLANVEWTWGRKEWIVPLRSEGPEDAPLNEVPR